MAWHLSPFFCCRVFALSHQERVTLLYVNNSATMSTKESKKEKAREVIDILQEISVLLVRDAV